jgi:hypothetical protein
MVKKILLNKNLPFKSRIRNFLSYYQVLRGARIGWKDRFKKIFVIHPEFRTPDQEMLEDNHRKYWEAFSGKVSMNTYRVCKSISGCSTPEYIPEEIYVADIEATLNRDISIDYYNNKSFYNLWFPGSVFPKDFIHNVDGEFLDSNLNAITYNQVAAIAQTLDYPVVIKPTKDSGGGKNVFFPANPDELLSLIGTNKNLVVQEKIRQHEFFSKYNPHGLNSIRVSLYRSVRDNKIHVLNSTLRMGMGGSLDNETAGGIYSLINEDGRLNGYAINKDGTRFERHPDTLLGFDEKIPDMEGLRELAIKVTSRIFYARIVSLDACYDAGGNWRIIEANVLGQHTIRFAQYSGQPFFNRFTAEVVEYCKENHWALLKTA